MEYRVEQKFLVTDAELVRLAARLKTVMSQDVHQDGDAYEIRSLYFDDLNNSCMDENEMGVDRRRKFRIRTYSPHADRMKLEIKEKSRGYTKKTSDTVTRTECMDIMRNRYPAGFDSRTTLNALKLEWMQHRMKPVAIISYERTAFVYDSGNVRITFDRNISASKYCHSFLNDNIIGAVPVLPRGTHVLEVKYDTLLPQHIAQLLELGNLQRIAFSKYYLGRLAIVGEEPSLLLDGVVLT